MSTNTNETICCEKVVEMEEAVLVQEAVTAKEPRINKKRLAFMLGVGLSITVVPTLLWAAFVNDNGNTASRRNGEDLLQPLRERQRVIVADKFYGVEGGTVVHILRVTPDGFVAELPDYFNGNPKGMIICYDKNGAATTPKDKEYNILRPLDLMQK
ncbi:TPA: hypothetical protein DDW35_05120 [Candidatus Sumerlaeota bacterium]|jgi:hypothetical protein|nr:hypothetical protein [Candidatus Sumerlaeota bacterium]